ncbi:MAG TPA: hypothetical protein PL104_02925 [Caldisericia bacterium]|nr:hypothetical protein [Caldisericia bacterium]HQP00439.1 hypothetical protein [Caldisericia bacterium]
MKDFLNIYNLIKEKVFDTYTLNYNILLEDKIIESNLYYNISTKSYLDMYPLNYYSINEIINLFYPTYNLVLETIKENYLEYSTVFFNTVH